MATSPITALDSWLLTQSSTCGGSVWYSAALCPPRSSASADFSCAWCLPVSMLAWRLSVNYALLRLLRAAGVGVREFVETLEDVMIDVCAYHGVGACGRQKDQTGVWVDDRKIGQIGIRVSKGCVEPAVPENAPPRCPVGCEAHALTTPRRHLKSQDLVARPFLKRRSGPSLLQEDCCMRHLGQGASCAQQSAARCDREMTLAEWRLTHHSHAYCSRRHAQEVTSLRREKKHADAGGDLDFDNVSSQLAESFAKRMGYDSISLLESNVFKVDLLGEDGLFAE